MGLLEALKDLRKSGVEVDVVFVGFDTSPKLVQELQDGNIQALVSQRPHKMGSLAVETIVKHLRGEKIAPRIDTGVELVTRERLEKEPEIRELVGLE
jgi:ribose transport system substrate-binding protein